MLRIYFASVSQSVCAEFWQRLNYLVFAHAIEKPLRKQIEKFTNKATADRQVGLRTVAQATPYFHVFRTAFQVHLKLALIMNYVVK